MVTFSTADYVKMSYSVALVIFSIVIVTALQIEVSFAFKIDDGCRC